MDGLTLPVVPTLIRLFLAKWDLEPLTESLHLLFNH